MLQGLSGGRPAFLASVTDASEAACALRAGADVIDAKNPHAGALGALDAVTLRAIVKAVAGKAPVSATVGDLEAVPGLVADAAEATAATGVDIVKVGFFGDGDEAACVARLGAARLGKARLVAVLMADCSRDLSLLPCLAAQRFAGVMFDTADKTKGALTHILPRSDIETFMKEARRLRLLAGLAGSLRVEDIAALVPLEPDVLGFRGALCEGTRTGMLDFARTAALRNAIDAEILARNKAKRSVA